MGHQISKPPEARKDAARRVTSRGSRLKDARKRPFAGYAAQALAVAMIAAAHNVQAANLYPIAHDPDITLLKNKHIQTRPKQHPFGSRLETPTNPRRRRAA